MALASRAIGEFAHLLAKPSYQPQRLGVTLIGSDEGALLQFPDIRRCEPADVVDMHSFVRQLPDVVEEDERRKRHGCADVRPLATSLQTIGHEAGAGIAYWLSRDHGAPRPTPIDAIAVLPFTNEDAQTAHLSDGLTEILIDSLSRLPDMRVMARTTVFEYKGKDPLAAGHALNVGAVVVGNFRREGDRTTIHVELIDVHDGTQLWGDQFGATPATLTTVQSRISAELSDQLRQGVDRDRRRLASHRYTSDPKAYDLYLWGLYSWNKRGKNDLLSAEQYFKGAIDRDPNFAAAYAGLAETYGVMVGYGAMPVADGVPKILDAAEKALQLDPNNAEALVSLATTKFRSMWDFAGADRDYRRAFALNPNYATGHEWYADLLRCMGRWNESRREIELAYKLDPLSPAINAMMCYSLYYERRYKEAIAFSRRASKLDPSLAAPSCVAYSYFSLGNIAGTIELMKQTKGPLGECDEMMADAYRRSGPRDFYRTGAEVLIQKQSASIETPVSIAAMYARNGDKDQAFAWLDKAFDRRVSHLMEVNVDPAFDSLRTDARYAALLQRIGLPRVTPPQAPVTN